MSKSFLVESLLMTDDVKNASICSRYSQYMSDAVVDMTVNQLSTRRNNKLAHRNKPLNAHVPAGSHIMQQFDHQWQYHRSATYHRSSTSLPNHYVCFQPIQAAAAAVDAYVQLQTLAEAMHISAQYNGSMADTHQRRRHINNVHQSLKLATTSYVPCSQQLANYYHNDSQPQQQNQADLHDSCLTSLQSTSASRSEQNIKLTPHDVVVTPAVDDVSDDDSVSKISDVKRIRTTFTNGQLLELERQFAANMYLSRLRRIEISAYLKLSEKQIKIWFQNHRVKYKKELMMEDAGGDLRHDDVVSRNERRHCACQLRTCRKQRQTTMSETCHSADTDDDSDKATVDNATVSRSG